MSEKELKQRLRKLDLINKQLVTEIKQCKTELHIAKKENAKSKRCLKGLRTILRWLSGDYIPKSYK